MFGTVHCLRHILYTRFLAVGYTHVSSCHDTDTFVLLVTTVRKVALMMKTISTSETSVNYETTRATSQKVVNVGKMVSLWMFGSARPSPRYVFMAPCVESPYPVPGEWHFRLTQFDFSLLGQTVFTLPLRHDNEINIVIRYSSFEWYNHCVMNCEGYGRKRSWPGIVSKTIKLLRIADLLAKVRARYLHNTKKEF